MNSKTCIKCGETKSLEEFYADNHGGGSRHGRRSACKTCELATDADYRRRLRDRSALVLPDTKTCSKCHSIKPASEFSHDSGNLRGIKSYCKKCCNEHQRKSRAADPVKTKMGSMVNTARQTTKRGGLLFDIDLDYLMKTFGHLTHCPILGMEFDWGARGHAAPNSPSLDKIDPALGYVKGKVQVISGRANSMKSDSDLGERLAFANFTMREVAQFYVNPEPSEIPQRVFDIAASYATKD
jgi:hypothetical protein